MRDLERAAAAHLLADRDRAREEREKEEREEQAAVQKRARLAVLEAILKNGVAWPGEY